MQKYTAIILTSKEIGEFDRLYFLYTQEQGLIKVPAKGVRRPTAKLAGHLEPATLSEVYVARSRGRGQITSAITVENFKKIKNSLDKLQVFIGISKFFSRFFSEGEEDKKIFDLLQAFLQAIDRNAGRGKKEKDELATLAFWWKIFDQMGQKPEVINCLICKEKLRGQSPNFSSRQKICRDSPKPDFRQKNYFSISKGGIICSSCVSRGKNIFPISENQIKLLRLFLSNSLENVIKIKISDDELKGLTTLTKNFRCFYF